jgi:hypothetical protein
MRPRSSPSRGSHAAPLPGPSHPVSSTGGSPAGSAVTCIPLLGAPGHTTVEGCDRQSAGAGSVRRTSPTGRRKVLWDRASESGAAHGQGGKSSSRRLGSPAAGALLAEPGRRTGKPLWVFPRAGGEGAEPTRRRGGLDPTSLGAHPTAGTAAGSAHCLVAPPRAGAGTRPDVWRRLSSAARVGAGARGGAVEGVGRGAVDGGSATVRTVLSGPWASCSVACR